MRFDEARARFPVLERVACRAPGEPFALVARLYDAGVHAREIPRAGLVRASCGWWTSDADIERLVAEVAA